VQVLQIALPQKTELLKTNNPSESLQSDTSAIFEEKFSPADVGNKPAKPAHLQEAGAASHKGGSWFSSSPEMVQGDTQQSGEGEHQPHQAVSAVPHERDQVREIPEALRQHSVWNSGTCAHVVAVPCATLWSPI